MMGLGLFLGGCEPPRPAFSALTFGETPISLLGGLTPLEVLKPISFLSRWELSRPHLCVPVPRNLLCSAWRLYVPDVWLSTQSQLLWGAEGHFRLQVRSSPASTGAWLCYCLDRVSLGLAGGNPGVQDPGAPSSFLL